MDKTNFNTWEDAVASLISQADKQDIVKACYYDSPLKSAAERYFQSNEWQAITAYLPSMTGVALDIGAGRGISSYALAQSGWQVTALEPDPSELVGGGAIQKLATEEKLAITVVQEFGENLPFADVSFDLVFARQVLHHASDLPQLCREISRVLKPGGVFIAVRDHVIAKKSDLQKFLDVHPLHNLYGGENAFLLQEYLDAIRFSPLKVEHVFGAFDTPINYAPHTENTLKQEFVTRSNHIFGGVLLSSVLTHNIIFPYLLKILSKIDRRPGRAVSFICRKLE
jgi:SAM-dependent methyltransferase